MNVGVPPGRSVQVPYRSTATEPQKVRLDPPGAYINSLPAHRASGSVCGSMGIIDSEHVSSSVKNRTDHAPQGLPTAKVDLRRTSKPYTSPRAKLNLLLHDQTQSSQVLDSLTCREPKKWSLRVQDSAVHPHPFKVEPPSTSGARSLLLAVQTTEVLAV